MLWTYFSVVRFALFDMFDIYVYFYIFQGGFEVLKLQYLSFCMCAPLSEAYSESTQTSKMALYAESFILDA